MAFQEVIGSLKTFKECIKKPTEKGDIHNKFLLTKANAKGKVKEYRSEHCDHENLNQENFGRDRV